MQPGDASNPKAYRLPTTVVPHFYQIALDARLGRAEFHGHVAIQLEVTAPTSEIVLHAHELRVSEAQLATRGEPLTGEARLDAEREIAIITFGQPLPIGPATLSLAFSGSISTSREGLFESKDGPDDLLCSHCEPTGARAIIPCFDEPTFKARFAWQVTTAPEATVLTNGRLLSAAPSADGAARTWTFAPTQPMSSYLLAVVIGDVASTPERVVNGVPLRIWAPRGKEHLGQFALDYTARLLPFYEEYFAAPYHFEKLDQAGVPSFFGGAMENAGLIISDLLALLVDPQSASQQQEMLAASTIAHEFAHMWFGDLVTMRWWDDLWLNEAFASWMAYHAVEALSPHYHIWDEVQGGTNAALAVDALASSHAIYHPVETPRGIVENIDVITYQKGGAVLRMVQNFLGDETFRAGLRTYMAEFAEANATGPDLWRHLQQASHLPVGQVMESWILQAGHPLIQVGIEGAGAQTRLSVRQQRFFASAQPPASDQFWQVPLVIRYEDDAGTHEHRALLTERATTLALAVTGSLRWCYANADEVGFYRQRLDAPLLQRLLANLDRLSAAERKGLLRDQLALVSNGSQAIPAYLDVLGALAGSDDQTLVGQVVSDHLRRVENLLEAAGDERAITGFRAWVAARFGARMAALGFEPRAGESTETAQLRAHVLAAMTLYAHDAGAIEQARAWQARDAADPGAVDPTLTPIFASATAQFGDAATYERFLSIYEQRKHGGATPQQMEYYARALARFPQPELEARTLALLQGETFPFITMGGLLASLLFQPRTQVAAWEWIKANWAMIETRAPMFIPPLVEISGVLPVSLRADVAAFWEAHLHGEYAGAVARALEQMDQNADFQARTRDDLLAYFTRQAPEAGAPTPATPAVPSGEAGAPSEAAASAPEPSSATFGARLTETPTEQPTGHLTPTAPIIPRAPGTESAPGKRGGWLRRLFGGRR